MYTVRLFMRTFARERPLPLVDRRLAHSRQRNPKKFFSRTDSDQLAGIRRQAAAMEYSPDEFVDLDNMDDEEINMSMAEQVYDAHLGEVRWKESKHALAEYGQKHYKPPKEPALLSWEDMQQIRSLHDNEKWPISALSKSFPASRLVIEKVLKSKWNPSIQDQYKHDEKVAENWILLRKGKLEISDPLREHCVKFTNRVAKPMTSKDLAAINFKPPKPPGSFLNLLVPPNIEKDRKRDKPEKEVMKRGEQYEDGDYYQNRTLYHLRKKITLEEARKQELESIADSETVNDDVKSFVYGSGPSKGVLPQDKDMEKNTSNKNTYSEQSVATKSTKNTFVSKWDDSGKSAKAAKDALMAPIEDYPDQITIPEAVKKPGAIFRVEDCFYNEHGEFLYRVPGWKF